MNEKKSAMLERAKKTSAAHKAKKEAAANARIREVLAEHASSTNMAAATGAGATSKKQKTEILNCFFLKGQLVNQVKNGG